MIVDDANLFPEPPPPPRPPPTQPWAPPATGNYPQLALNLLQEMCETPPAEPLSSWAYLPRPANPPLGPNARALASGPCGPQSKTDRQRTLASIEEAAPDSKLMELRMLARQSEHTGISAWRTFRDKELGR